MQELLRLLGHGVDDRRRRVADAGDTDAAGEIDEGVAVDVEEQAILSALDDDVGGPAQTGGQRGVRRVEQRSGARPWHLGR